VRTFEKIQTCRVDGGYLLCECMDTCTIVLCRSPKEKETLVVCTQDSPRSLINNSPVTFVILSKISKQHSSFIDHGG
jgi:hypothetical protein